MVENFLNYKNAQKLLILLLLKRFISAKKNKNRKEGAWKVNLRIVFLFAVAKRSVLAAFIVKTDQIRLPHRRNINQ